MKSRVQWFKRTNDGFAQCIIMVSDGITSNVPADSANTDYQAYLAWVAEGNVAEEWNPNAH